MKTFIYCRPSVSGGDRGYRVFPGDGLTSADAKQLRDLFSDRDPDMSRLDRGHYAPFFASFRWQDDAWIFGRGRIEAQGQLGAMYASYLFHGCILTEAERRELHYNPFVLADFFNLEKDRRLSMPSLPASLPAKALFLNVQHKAQRLLTGDEENRIQLAGAMAAALYRLDDAEQFTFNHRAGYDGDFWSLVFFLLPKPIRASFSVVTWEPFLELRPRLRGLVAHPENSTHGPPTQHFDSARISPTFGEDFIRRLGKGGDKDALMLQMRMYEVAMADWHSKWKADEGTDERHFLESLFRAMERPSVRSASDWPAAGRHLFPHKVAHFRDIWSRHRWEFLRFQDLPGKLWQTLAKDAVALTKEKDRDAQRVLETLSPVFGELKPRLTPLHLGTVLTRQPLAAWFNKQISATDWIDAIASIPPKEITRTALEARRLEDAKTWQGCFQRLVILSWGRTMKMADPKETNAWLDVLEMLHGFESESFLQASRDVISSRALEHVFPLLAPRTSLAKACLSLWSETVTEQDGGNLNRATSIIRLTNFYRLMGESWSPPLEKLKHNRVLLMCLDRMPVLGKE